MTRLIAIASGKGGVGKTTTTVNLGVALTHFNKNIIIIDANLTTPNIGLHLGMHGTLTTLNDVLEGKASIVDAIHLHSSGLRVIPAAMNLNRLKTTKPERLWDVVLDLFGSADIVLLDTPAGLESGAKSVLDSTEEVLIVTNPERPAVTDALKTIRMAYNSGAYVLGVVVNKYRGDEHDMKIPDIESALDLSVIGTIPYDEEVRKSIRLKGPVVVRAPRSKSAHAFKKLAATLVGVEYELPAEGRPIVQALKRIFGFE